MGTGGAPSGIAWLVAAAVVVVACGGGEGGDGDGATEASADASPQADSQAMNPEALSIESADGAVALEIPAGAIPAGTDVTVAPVPIDEAPASFAELGSVAALFDLQPDGLTFDTAATLSYRVPLTDGDPTAIPVVIGLLESGGEVTALAEQHLQRHDTGDVTLTASIEHFSTVGFFDDVLTVTMTPESATAEVDSPSSSFGAELTLKGADQFALDAMALTFVEWFVDRGIALLQTSQSEFERGPNFVELDPHARFAIYICDEVGRRQFGVDFELFPSEDYRTQSETRQAFADTALGVVLSRHDFSEEPYAASLRAPVDCVAPDSGSASDPASEGEPPSTDGAPPDDTVGTDDTAEPPDDTGTEDSVPGGAPGADDIAVVDPTGDLMSLSGGPVPPGTLPAAWDILLYERRGTVHVAVLAETCTPECLAEFGIASGQLIIRRADGGIEATVILQLNESGGFDVTTNGNPNLIVNGAEFTGDAFEFDVDASGLPDGVTFEVAIRASRTDSIDEGGEDFAGPTISG